MGTKFRPFEISTKPERNNEIRNLLITSILKQIALLAQRMIPDIQRYE